MSNNNDNNNNNNDNNDNPKRAKTSGESSNFKAYKRTERVPVRYGEYLNVSQITSAQHPKSEEFQEKASHDELLFIITHQAYELWFKQILFEVDSVRELLLQPKIAESDMTKVVHRLKRVTAIQKLLIDQIGIMETMTPLDFLDFRDYLWPASGFQSLQFRLIEVKLGLRQDQRNTYQRSSYLNKFSEEEQRILLKAESEPSVMDMLEKWLGRTPFLDMPNFHFWPEYKLAVDKMIADDRLAITDNPILDKEEKEKQLKELDTTIESFQTLFDEKKHNELIEKGQRRLSHKAYQAAVLINIYSELPILHLPFQFLHTLVEIDENITTWRYRHVMMVHRMLGTKIGTGGSSGYHYLRSTLSDNYKVFADLFNLSTYLIPREYHSQLPKSALENLGFKYSE